MHSWEIYCRRLGGLFDYDEKNDVTENQMCGLQKLDRRLGRMWIMKKITF